MVKIPEGSESVPCSPSRSLSWFLKGFNTTVSWPTSWKSGKVPVASRRRYNPSAEPKEETPGKEDFPSYRVSFDTSLTNKGKSCAGHVYCCLCDAPVLLPLHSNIIFRLLLLVEATARRGWKPRVRPLGLKAWPHHHLVTLKKLPKPLLFSSVQWGQWY